MDREELENFAIRVQTAVLSGDAAAVRKLFQLPLVVYSKLGPTFVRSEEEFFRVLNGNIQAIEDLTPASGTTELLYHSKERHGRFKIVAQNRIYNTAGEIIGGSKLCYFVVRQGSDLVIEMLEYIETPLDLKALKNIYL